jgi:hypothetical protein
MSDATLAHAPAPTDEQIDRILDATADSFVRQLRSPILHAPSEQKLNRSPFRRSTAARAPISRRLKAEHA